MKKFDITKFYSDLELLNFKFPVAEIAKRTDYSKGTISEYLNRHKEPSDKFLKSFYSEFQNDLQGIKPKTVDRVLSHDALLSVVVGEIASLKSQQTGEPVQLLIEKIYKASEDVLKMM